MSFRLTLVLAFLLLLIGGYAYYFEYKGAQKKEKEEEQKKTLLEIKKEDVSQVQLQGLEQPVTIVPAKEDKWKLTAPLETPADDATVERIFNAVEKLQFKEIVEEQPKDLSQYELDKPKLTLTFDMKKGEKRTVYVGSKNPVENIYYIRVNNDRRVYLVESGVGDLATITVFDLRDKELTEFSSDDVTSITINSGKRKYVFERSGNLWKISEPIQAPASDGNLTSLLSSLEYLRASRFAEEDDLQEGVGLNPPAASIELILQKGLKQKIEFGKKEGSDIFVQVEGTPGVAVVNDSFTTYFEKAPEDWRETKLIVFNRYDVQEIRIQTGGKQYAFNKGSEDNWNQQSPEKGKVQNDKIDDLLEKLETAEIKKYGTSPSVAKTEMDISITLKDYQDKVSKKHLVFGSPENDLLPAKNDDYNTIVFAEPSLVQDLQKLLSELKPAPSAAKK